MERQTLIEALEQRMRAEPWIEAAWLGGSEATGRTDARSDVDVQLLVAAGHEEDAFALAEEVLDALGGIARTWRASVDPQADYLQRFYLPEGAPEHLMLDLCVMRADRLGPYLDPRRHGQPVVWFDRIGALVPTPDPALAARRAERLAQLRQRVPMLAHIPGKELARGDLPAAVGFYHRLLLGSLVELLRIRLCPDRFDFGVRYLGRDLPPEVLQRLEPLLLPGSAEQLERCIHACRVWLDEELRIH